MRVYLCVQVACGLNHTLVVSADGLSVWAFGDGDYGKLGLGNSTAKSSPQVSHSHENVASIFKRVLIEQLHDRELKT